MPVAPPFPRLPSLNALRAFEAAARLGGFALAGEELQVSPGAVAAQIKALEQEIGGALFVRHARGVDLTPLGRRALPGFVAAFDSLGLAVTELRREAVPGKVHIAALPALAELWLAPRLPAIRETLPEVDISITAMETPPNLKRVPFDLCLFYAPDGSSAVAQDDLLPVCTRAVATTLQRPEDLLEAVCLTDSAWARDWQIWADEALPGREFTPKGPVFSLYSLAVQEALSGAGVLMAHRSLVAGHLASGALVAPFPVSVPLKDRISLWSLPGGRGNAVVDTLASELRRLSVSDG
ncbi:LysR family transcriptional regulator [Roseibium sediminicola]|uniref:LysR family transcriptional regulator n=1 Tax=Roseibium sediminicola TaxID=2933272 RepID=A0ABT0GNK8_9HYPH|nr:LysR family transcriptional regulator [Roseibium sp. CAU 1639]MCK7611003.1 LysR family transcriptional regulator [Roseibium sp. CAU 1639]